MSRFERGLVELGAGASLDLDSLAFRTSRSSGPGGQNVNKVETRVEVLLDLEAATTFEAGALARVRGRLATRISQAGVLRVASQAGRTQAENRERAIERLIELLREAIAVDPPRRPTRPSRGAKQRRLAGKRQRSEVKRTRTRVPTE